MKPTHYFAKIYIDDGGDGELLVDFKSTTPFQTFAVGDILNPDYWAAWTARNPQSVLRVVRIGHEIVERDAAIHHAIGVYTVEIQNRRGLFFEANNDTP